MTLPRREFIGKLGTASAAFLAANPLATHPLFGKAAKSNDRNSVLVETAHFGSTGGWVLDNQFANQLGFSYLLAHGMGKPVENATARIEFPQAGRYHAWVLTKDWCPGDWEAPGRFRVALGEEVLTETFGTQSDWGWQSGGAIEISQAQLSNTIALQDLTGFEGRCSAIYFSLDAKDAPPSSRDALSVWRREKVGLPSQAVDQGLYDLVIVGGGISGCAASLAANSQGLKVALIQNRPVLGGNASSEVRVHTLGIHGQAADILEQIDTPHYPNGSAEAHQAEEKRMNNMAAAENVEVYLNHSLVSAETKSSRIRSVEVLDTTSGTLKRFAAPQFIDCTGDGWLGAMAGADYRYGREPKSEFDEGWEEHGELWSPEKSDDRVMGSSVLWYTKATDRRVDFPSVPWAKPVAKEHVATAGEWQWEYSDNDLHQIDDAEQIRDHMFRAIYGSYANAIKRRQNANLELDWVAYVAGKRESRRLLGAHIFSGSDARDSVKFPDTVVIEERSIDVHYQEKLTGLPVDFISEAIFQKPKDKYYYIPYRSLYSRNVPNLQMAGRCFSCSHVGLGGPRVMNTCGQMGVATGYAAALCQKHATDPAKIGQDHLDELQAFCGHST